jgi:hypothetical protein
VPIAVGYCLKICFLGVDDPYCVELMTSTSVVFLSSHCIISLRPN